MYKLLKQCKDRKQVPKIKIIKRCIQLILKVKDGQMNEKLNKKLMSMLVKMSSNSKGTKTAKDDEWKRRNSVNLGLISRDKVQEELDH